MTIVREHGQYIDIVKAVNNSYRPIVTNCYLSSDMIDRYIEHGDFYYQEIEKGVLFFADERYYLKAYYHMNPDAVISGLPEGKTIVIQNLYKKKNERLLKIEKGLQRAGFSFSCMEYQMQADVNVVRDRLKKVYEQAEMLSNVYKYKLILPDKSYFKQIREMQFEISGIPFWRFYQYSDDELLKDAGDGKLRCVVGADGKIMGVVHMHADGMGWIAVKNEYRRVPGISVMLRMPTQNATGRLKGWIRPDNKESMDFHIGAGYSPTGLNMDEWLIRAD